MSKDETKQDAGAAAPEDTLTEDPSLTPPAAELPVNPRSGRSERVPSYSHADRTPTSPFLMSCAVC